MMDSDLLPLGGISPEKEKRIQIFYEHIVYLMLYWI